MDFALSLIGRSHALFKDDVAQRETSIRSAVKGGRFLVIGGAGSIGQAVVKEVFKRGPAALHVIDLDENDLVELVRDIRSSLGYIEGDFQALPLDCSSVEYEAFILSQNPYDYVLNFSALKHVRSEKDPYTLMRLIDVNILNSERIARQAAGDHSKKYFCVSTDKAANPVNMMGASKRIMEMFMMRRSFEVTVSTARFANVAFSDGSLLHGYNQRIQKKQPLAAPRDVKRYFLSQGEAGELCLMSCLFGENRDIFFPKLNEKVHLIRFSQIAERYLESLGYEPFMCSTEHEARARVHELIRQKKWPCYFFDSDTTGEKKSEEFYTGEDIVDLHRFKDIGVIRNIAEFDENKLNVFQNAILAMRNRGYWTKSELVELFRWMLPEFDHKETYKYLDQRM